MAQGRITDASIAAVREGAKIDRVVADYVTLKKAGVGSLKGLCPFHDEKGPSFNVSPDRNTFHCFGCGEGGDVISFLMKIENLDFIDTIERLADRFAIPLQREEYTPRPGSSADTGPVVDRATRARLIEANTAAAQFYVEQLFSPEAEQARRFLSERGFNRDDVAPYLVGYAPNGWDVLIKHLTALGFTRDELLTAGLTSDPKESGRHIDRFRGRLMFPIRDQSGTVIGFGARKLLSDEQDKGPKYLNTPETPLYKKSRVLYGLDMARKPIATTRRVIVVEGYTDVIACHLSGEPTAVATCGTAFGEDHVRIVRRLLGDDGNGGEVIYTFDGDSAGQKAAIKAFSLDSHFQTRTLVAVEPSGMDPCEVRLHRGAEGINALLADRIPLFEFAIKTELSQFDLASVEGRGNSLSAIAPILASIRQSEVRDQYVLRVARWIGADPENVRRAAAMASPSSAPQSMAPRAPEANTSDVPPEDDAPTESFERPDATQFRNAAAALKVVLHGRRFMQLAAAELTATDFLHPTYRAVWQALLDATADETTANVDAAGWVAAVMDRAAKTSPTVRSVVTELSATPAHLRTTLTNENALKTALMLVLESSGARMDHIMRAISNPNLSPEEMDRAQAAWDKAHQRHTAAQDRLNEIDGSHF
jgi:DNA primase